MSKRKLLLADDSITIQKVVNLTFADEGIEVITVGDGDEAMRKFTESAPDLVMADVNMPGMDGYSICEMIKADETTRKIPVILLVGSFEPFDEEKARHAGADDFLTKPFQSIRQLVHKVSSLLKTENGESAPENEFSEIPQSTSTEELRSELQISDELGDAGMDDETILTDQIGTIPTNEYHKFESSGETHRQFADENSAGESETNTEENYSIELNSDDRFQNVIEAETQPLSQETFGKISGNLNLNNNITTPEQTIYEFADEDNNFEVQTEHQTKSDDSDVRELIEQSYSTEIEPDASSMDENPEIYQENTDSAGSETRETYQDDEDSINEMSETHQDVNHSLEETEEIGATHQENADAIFEFDDLNLLEIPTTSEDETSETLPEPENEISQEVNEPETQVESFETQPFEEEKPEQNNQEIAVESGENSNADQSISEYSQSAESNRQTSDGEHPQSEIEIQENKEIADKTSEILEDFSPEVIDAIAERVIEKLSYRALREIANQVAPQIASLIVQKMKEDDANT